MDAAKDAKSERDGIHARRVEKQMQIAAEKKAREEQEESKRVAMRLEEEENDKLLAARLLQDERDYEVGGLLRHFAGVACSYVHLLPT